MSKHIQVEFVFQDLHNLPEGFAVPEGRVKPWGTGHAIMSCIDVIDGPFAVINADDYYGRHAFETIYEFLTTHEDDDLYRYVIFLIWQNRMIVETGSKTRVG